jgi:hypothetical protein
MRKFLILGFAFLSLSAFAQTAAEEAMILNQELQFLEDSINNVQSVSINSMDENTSKDRALNEPSLERTYFGETEEDVVSTRTSGPKRRGL